MTPKRHEQSMRANISNPLAFMVEDVWVEERRAGGTCFVGHDGLAHASALSVTG
jgi:hypothetical protein